MKQSYGNPIYGEAIPSGTVFEDGSGPLYVGTGGDVVVDFMGGGSAITLKNVQDGSIIPFMIKKVYGSASGTTATDLVAVK